MNSSPCRDPDTAEEELDEFGLPGESDLPPEDDMRLHSTQGPTWPQGPRSLMGRWALSRASRAVADSDQIHMLPTRPTLALSP